MIHRARGFTLLEIMVVLVIAAVAFTIVPVMLAGTALTTEIRGSVRQLASGLRAARSEAITRQVEGTVTVDLEARRFQVSGRAREGQLPDAESVEIKLYTAQEELVDDSIGRIRFFPDGSSTGGHVSMMDERVEYRVNVDWLTGRVDIVERDRQP